MDPLGIDRPVVDTVAAATMLGVVPDPDAATQLAYSMPPAYPWPVFPEPEPQEGVRHGLRSATVKACGAAIAVGIGAATMIIGLFGLHRGDGAHSVPATMTVVAAPPEPVTVTAKPPPPPPTPDERYLKLWTQLTGFDVVDPVPVIALGHTQCDYLSLPGNTPATATATLMAHYTAPRAPDGSTRPLTRKEAYAMVEAPVYVYCPEFKAQL